MPLTEPTGADAVWSPPRSFDQFVVERPLGSGGMGRVYLARDVALDRPVALKFISSAAPSPAARSRFVVEARAIAKLSHPNVVSVYSFGEVDHQPFIAYEFVAGQSLDKLLKPIGWETVLRLAVGLARGLDAAHRAGILHRDIKPGNAVLSERGEIKLLDFGLAKLAAEPEQDPSDGAQDVDAEGDTEHVRSVPSGDGPSGRSLTRPSMLMGTPAYLAPELWLGERASPRSDVFALGLVIYELLVGKLPHAHQEHEEMARTIISGSLPRLRARRPELPESLSAIVDRCLRVDAAERFPSAVELLKALEEVQTVFLPASGGVNAVQIEPERLAVATSLARISGRLGVLTAGLYERLFAAAPSVRSLFPEDLRAQQAKLAHALQLAVNGLADPESLAPALEDLGRRHVHYGVTAAHFEPLEKALLGALAEVDAAAWSPELERSWRRAFAFIEGAMSRGMAAEKETVASGVSLRIRRASLEVPRTRYATRGDLSIAYQIVGEGPVDIVFMVGWLSHVEIGWQHESFATFVRALAGFARVILFDKRGTGMSDRAFQSATIEDRVDDLELVLDHVGSKSAFLFGVSEGATTAAMFAVMRPSRVRGIILYNGAARLLEAPDYPQGLSPAFLEEFIAKIRTHWGEPALADLLAPSKSADTSFRDWFALYMRMSASPGTAITMLRLNARVDLREVLPMVRVPALVLHRSEGAVSPRGNGRYLSDRIPGARLVELEGADHLPFVGDSGAVLRAIERFVGDVPAAAPNPQPIVAVLALVGEEELAPAFVAMCSERAAGLRGRRIDDDRALAFSFDGGVRAVRCARDLLDLAAREGVRVRVGLDAGPCGALAGEPCSCARAESAAELARSASTGTARLSALLQALAVGSDLPITPEGTDFLLRAGA